VFMSKSALMPDGKATSAWRQMGRRGVTCLPV